MRDWSRIPDPESSGALTPPPRRPATAIATSAPLPPEPMRRRVRHARKRVTAQEVLRVVESIARTIHRRVRRGLRTHAR